MTDYATLFADRYGTALLADAAHRAGVDALFPAPGLRPLDRRAKLAGPALTVEANNDLASILDAVHRANVGEVIVISNRTEAVGLMGDLIGTEAVRKGIAGFVVDGSVRDSIELIDLGLPVLCLGSYPVGPLKLSENVRGIGEVGGPVSIAGASIASGTWVFGDADGMIGLQPEDLEKVFERAGEAWEREEALADEIASGRPLGDAFALESFLTKRAQDPQASFERHLSGLGRDI